MARLLPLRAGILVLAGGLLARPCAAQPAAALAVGVSSPVTSMDPHYHNLSPNIALDRHLYAGLTDTDGRAKVVPSIAESWRLVDDATWEFTLRPGVRFQDGTPFEAEDVAFTLDRVPRVPNAPSSFSVYTQSVRSVDVVDPRTVRLHTRGVYPLLPTDLSQVMMLSRKLHAAAATEDFNSGKAAIGTGPYRLLAFRPGDRVEMERWDGYWGAKPAWAHVTTRFISNDAARTAALLAGDVQVADAVPTTDQAKLRADARVSLSEVVGLRVIYLAMDQSRDGPTPDVSGPNGEKLERNPLRDPRVRLALSLAINRQAIVDRVMEGAAVPAGQFLPEGAFGAVPGLGAPAYDPARARALLTEAGYPNGLRVTLRGSNDRYVNDARILQAIGQMWTRAGVATTVATVPYAALVGPLTRQEYSVYMGGWGNATGEASSPLRSLVGTWDPPRGMGVANRGRASNPEVDALLARALGTADDPAREALLRDATRVSMQDVQIIPLHVQKNAWAVRAGLRHAPRMDEETRAMDVTPAP